MFTLQKMVLNYLRKTSWVIKLTTGLSSLFVLRGFFVLFVCLFVCLSSLKDTLIDFREKGRERDREGEKHQYRIETYTSGLRMGPAT